MAHSVSSRALDVLLEQGGEVAEAIKESKIHRTQLWKYRTGKRKPEADTIAILDRLSGGAVPANGWEDLPEDEQTPPRTESSSALKAVSAPAQATGTDDASDEG